MFAERALSGLLCVLLVSTPTPAAAEQANTTRPAYRAQLTGDARIVHALNRFTFGPRPGDVDAVRAQGLDAWFEQQLHPSSIPDAALDARLADYPAMRLSPAELIVRFPSNPVIRQVMDGKAPMPQQGLLRTVYENQLARMKAKKDEKAAAGSPVNPMMAASAAAPAMQEAGQQTAAPDQAESAERILALAPAQRVAELARMPQAELDPLLKAMKPPQKQALLAGMSPAMRETVEDLEAPERVVAGELMANRMTRDLYSERQLQEVMTDFWLNHFNAFLRKNETMPYQLVSFERDVVRPRALGNFEDLLEAVAHSPAMLMYLDQAESTGPGSMAAVRAHYAQWRNPDKKKKDVGLNENYARELMELHTLGVNGGYKQADVVQAARILTGWTIDRPQRGGGFRFDQNRHEPGTKKVMGQKFKDKGEKEGEQLLHFLATRPATAQFISRKLAVRFVDDNPPQPLVDRMAATFQRTHGDIAAVLRTLYKSPEFWSGDAYRAKVKTPLEFVVSAARAGNARLDDVRPLLEALRQMGMPLYGCIPPTGYKEDAADWVSTGALVNRMNFAVRLASGRMPGIAPQWDVAGPGSGQASAQASGLASAMGEQDISAVEARLEHALVAGGVSPQTRQAVLDQFAQQGGSGAKLRNVSAAARAQQGLLAGLLLGSPEFQRR